MLSESVVGTDGSVRTPLGSPGAVMLPARSPGRAVVDVVTVDPFRAPVTRSVIVRVEP